MYKELMVLIARKDLALRLQKELQWCFWDLDLAISDCESCKSRAFCCPLKITQTFQATSGHSPVGFV